MNRVRFISRRTAAALRPAAGAVLISIHDRSEAPLTLQPGWASVLVQRYHDTDGSLLGLELFDNDMANDVIAFAASNAECDEITVHCQQGHSRSAAVALFLSEKYGVPCIQDKTLVTRSSWNRFNRMVYERLKMADLRRQLYKISIAHIA